MQKGDFYIGTLQRPSKIDKILISSEKPPYTSFLRFRKNSFFREIGPLFPKLEVPPKCASSLFYTVPLDPDDSP